MKKLLAKTLTSTALVLGTFTTAHALSDNQGPWPADTDNQRWISPAAIHYFDQRTADVPVNSVGRSNPFPAASEDSPRWFSPDQIRYFEQREAVIAKQVKDRSGQSNSHYLPTPSNSATD
jgi:hypothetical protein